MISHFTSVHTNAIVSGEKLSQNFMFKISYISKIFQDKFVILHEVSLCTVMYIIFKMFCILTVYSGRDMKNAHLFYKKIKTSRFQNTKIKIKGKMGDTELLLSLQCKRTHLVFCRY